MSKAFSNNMRLFFVKFHSHWVVWKSHKTMIQTEVMMCDRRLLSLIREVLYATGNANI